MQVKIVYKSGQRIDQKLDTLMRKTLVDAGLRCYGSGFDHTTEERDIVFDYEEK